MARRSRAYAKPSSGESKTSPGRLKCSVKTVENVERGANVYMFTLAKFATALNVESSSLLAGAELPVDPPKKERRIEVNLTINIPFDDFDQSDQLIKPDRVTEGRRQSS